MVLAAEKSRDFTVATQFLRHVPQYAAVLPTLGPLRLTENGSCAELL